MSSENSNNISTSNSSNSSSITSGIIRGRSDGHTVMMRDDDDTGTIHSRECAVCGLHKPSYFRDLLRCEACSHQKKQLRASLHSRVDCQVCGLQQLPTTAFSNKSLDNAPLVGYLRCKDCVRGKKHTDRTLQKQLRSTQHRGTIYNEDYVETNVRRMMPNIEEEDKEQEHSVDTTHNTSRADRGSGGRGKGRGGGRSGRGPGRRKGGNGRGITPVHHHVQQSGSQYHHHHQQYHHKQQHGSPGNYYVPQHRLSTSSSLMNSSSSNSNSSNSSANYLDNQWCKNRQQQQYPLPPPPPPLNDDSTVGWVDDEEGWIEDDEEVVPPQRGFVERTTQGCDNTNTDQPQQPIIRMDSSNGNSTSTSTSTSSPDFDIVFGKLLQEQQRDRLFDVDEMTLMTSTTMTTYEDTNDNDTHNQNNQNHNN